MRPPRRALTARGSPRSRRRSVPEIHSRSWWPTTASASFSAPASPPRAREMPAAVRQPPTRRALPAPARAHRARLRRSEERRVGKGVDHGGGGVVNKEEERARQAGEDRGFGRTPNAHSEAG